MKKYIIRYHDSTDIIYADNLDMREVCTLFFLKDELVAIVPITALIMNAKHKN